MAYFGEEFLRCECGNTTFIENKILTIKKHPRRNIPDDINSEILSTDVLDKKLQYVCSKCGKEIDF